MWFWIRLLFLTLVSLVLVVFAVHNRSLISVSLFPLPLLMDIPAYAFAVVCFVVGFGCATLIGTWSKLARCIERHGNRQHLQAIETELNALRLEKQLSHDATH